MLEAANLLERYSVGSGKHYRASSLTVYGAILGKLESMALKKKETLLQVSQQTLYEFLGEQGNPNTAKRYACFLDDFYAHFKRKEVIEVSPAEGLREKYSYPEVASPTTGFSSDVDEVAFLRSLPAPHTWKRSRDAGLLALAVGAGLKLKEVIRLADQDMLLEGESPAVVVHHGEHSREVPIREIALPYVRAWDRVRRETGMGHLIEYFPATLHGGYLAPSTVFRHARSALLKAGIASLSHLGLSALRVSYARREASEGSAVPVLQRRLGHKRELSTLRVLGETTS